MDHYNLQEVWLPSVEALQASKLSTASGAQLGKLNRSKRVRFGSVSMKRTPSKNLVDDDGHSDDGDARSDESESTISWPKPPRSGVFTIDEIDLPRVTPEALKKHARCNIFLSSNFWNCERLLVLVQGSGPVRPGQWSRSLCLTHSIQAGSLLDYIELAQETKMGVIVLNPNHNHVKLRIRTQDQPVGTVSVQHSYDIPGHTSHTVHALSVYDQFIDACPAQEIYFVANGRGGDTVLQLLNHRFHGIPDTAAKGKIVPTDSLESVMDRKSNGRGLGTRVKAIAFINSAHSIAYANSDKVRAVIEERAVHWITSTLPLDTGIPEQSDNVGCTCVSSGTSKAEFSSACVVNSVFEFFFGRIAPNEEKPDWTPVSIAFSNPPQNVDRSHQGHSAITSSAPNTPKKISNGRADSVSNMDSLGGSDAIHHTEFSVTNANPATEGGANGEIGKPRRLSFGSMDSNDSLSDQAHHTSTSSTSDENEGNLITAHRRWIRRRLPSDHERYDPLLDHVEMVEMGTQTDASSSSTHLPPHNNAADITPTPQLNTSTPKQTDSFVPSSPSISLCLLCQFSNWLTASNTRIGVASLVLLAAGTFLGRYLVYRKRIFKGPGR